MWLPLAHASMPCHVFYFEGIGMQVREDNVQKETKFRKGWTLLFSKRWLMFPLCFGGLFIVYTLSYFVILTFLFVLVFLFFSCVLGHFQEIQAFDNKIIPISCVSTGWVYPFQTFRENLRGSSVYIMEIDNNYFDLHKLM